MIRRGRNLTALCYAAMTGELIHSLDRAAGTRLFRGTQVPRNAATAAATQRPVVVGPGGIVGTADQVGHRRVAPHSSAVRQRRATETQHLAVRGGDIDP